MSRQANLAIGAPQALVRYERHLAVASAGSIWLGRLLNGSDAGRTVILRRISKQWLSSKDAEWVLHGVEAYSKVRHPSLVKLLGVLEQDDDLVIISEHLEGVRLVDLQRTVFDEGVPIPATVAVRLVLDAARATRKAHRLAADSGIFPTERLFLSDGVLIAGYGGTLLTEVGVLSALARCVVPRTVPDLLAQLAPEELGARNVQAGSPEVFSLGVVLWELLANRWLFSRKSDSLTHQELLLSAIPSLDQIERFGMPVPEAMVNLVLRATDRDPSRRLASVNDLILALERLPAHFIAAEDQVAEVLRQRAGALLKVSKLDASETARSGTFAEFRSTRPSTAPPGASSQDWDRPTFAQSSLVSRPAFLDSAPSIAPTDAPPVQVPVQTGILSGTLRPRRRRAGFVSISLTMLTVGAFVLTFSGMPQRQRPTSSPAPAASVVPGPARTSPKTVPVEMHAANIAAPAPAAAPSPPDAYADPRTGAIPITPSQRATSVKRGPTSKPRPGESTRPNHNSSSTATADDDSRWGI